MRKVLGEDFFNRKTLDVTRDLLGKYLVRRLEGKEWAYLIYETEAYDGMKDLACHARNGQTPRNAPMFGKAGRAYVYFTYGMHFMLNLVTGPEGYPAAALIRGVGNIAGPGRVTKQLQIDKSLSAKKLTKDSGLWVEDRGVQVIRKDYERTPRIGINSAGPIWAVKPYRFVLKKEKCLALGEAGLLEI